LEATVGYYSRRGSQLGSDIRELSYSSANSASQRIEDLGNSDADPRGVHYGTRIRYTTRATYALFRHTSTNFETYSTDLAATQCYN